VSQVFARKALLHKGWADNVRLGIRDGRICELQQDATREPGDTEVGIVIPGLTNAHSHAFQRALAGHTEQRSPAGRDNFWTWRERMYALAGKLDADALSAIAAQAYSEMLSSGYTGVAEFHYLHDRDMANAVLTAGAESGIRLSYVPVLYERAGFDKPEPEGHQKLFALDVDRFLDHHARASGKASETISVGIGAHSLRAVSPDSLSRIVAAAEEQGIPMHIHVAEQQREVDQCLAAYGRRPVRWLLENFDVNDQWCLVHATHMDFDETESLAGAGAVACLCPSTEANLGDGLFPLHDYLSAGGRIAIGSDSHVSINPFEELRWLEYGQRLASQARNIASLENAHVGRELFERALAGGARAAGRVTNGIEDGAHADLVALYDEDPMLVGHDETSLLDALVFSGYRLPIDRVMVGGDWRVVNGDHVEREGIGMRYAQALERLGALQ
jgi:formimidoylglutamate deiminase